jgi:serine/threonine protein kinase
MIGNLLQQRYQIVKFLGKGGQGHTYLALDTQRPGNPQCVVKHLKPYIDDPKFLETSKRLFQTEAEILCNLTNHRQIPQLYAYFEQDKEFFLVEEFIEGQDLTKEIAVGQQQDESYVISLLKSLLPVLDFLHQKGVIHRDIKPPNVIRRLSDKELVLIDFGAVKQFQSELTRAMSVSIDIGSPGYTPSEQLRGRPKPSSDIYALGMMCVQALTGTHPRKLEEDDDTGEIHWQHLVSASSELKELVSKMIRHNLRERYRTASEVLIELQRLDNSYAETHIGTPVDRGLTGKNNYPNVSQAPAKSNDLDTVVSSPQSQVNRPQTPVRDNDPSTVVSSPQSQANRPQTPAKSNDLDTVVSSPQSQVNRPQTPARDNDPSTVVSSPQSQANRPQTPAKSNYPDTVVSSPSSQVNRPQTPARDNDPSTVVSSPQSQVNRPQTPAKSNYSDTVVSSSPSSTNRYSQSDPRRRSENKEKDNFIKKYAKFLYPLGGTIAAIGAIWGLTESGLFKSSPDPIATKPAVQTAKKEPTKQTAKKEPVAKKTQPATSNPIATLPPVKTPPLKNKTPAPATAPLPPSIPQPPPPEVFTPTQTPEEIEAKKMFQSAQKLAKVGKYKQAIIQADRIPVNAYEYYADAQTQIETWSDKLVEQAKQKYEQQGNYNEAIAMLRSIPVSVSAVSKAQELTETWSQEWESNQNFLKTARAAMEAKQKPEAIAAANNLTNRTTYWKNQKTKIQKQIAKLTPPQPVASENPNLKPEVTQQPVASEKPSPEPEVTQQPVASEKPSPKPEATQQPVANETPAAQPTVVGSATPSPKPEANPAPNQTAALHPDACQSGYVWREAVPGDRVCVTSQVKAEAAFDNSKAEERRNPSAYDPETCIDGYVWREITPDDRVCVTRQARARVISDNSLNASRKAKK